LAILIETLTLNGVSAITNDVIESSFTGSITVNAEGGWDISLLALEELFPDTNLVYWSITFSNYGYTVTETGVFEIGTTPQTAVAITPPYELSGDIENPITKKKVIGWQWDMTAWPDDQLIDLTAIPCIYDATTSGITTSYFKSGIGGGRDLELQKFKIITTSGVQQNPIGTAKSWIPEVYHGHYYLYSEKGYLHSDDSHYQQVSNTITVSGISQELNIVRLDYRPKIGVPVTAKQYKWSSSQGKYTVEKEVRKKGYFTGIRDDDNVRQLTWDSDREAILFDFIDDTNDEFVIVNSGEMPEAVFNKQFSEPSGDYILGSGEFLGYSDGSDTQEFHTTYAPIDRLATMEVNSYLGASGIFESWTIISGLNNILTGNQVAVDFDLGIVRFQPSGNIPSAGWSVETSYYKTVELEYEPQDTCDTVLALEADANPIRKYSDRGFVFLTDESLEATQIVLTADLPEISDDVYGPTYIGGNYVDIIATVTDRNDNAVEGSVVRFELTSTPVAGSFSGSATTISSITNSEGKATTYYNTPGSINDIGEYITTITVDNSPDPTTYPGITQTTTLQTSNMSIEGTTSDIFLFQVYSNDDVLGWTDTSISLTNIEEQLESYYSDFFSDQEIYGPTGLVIGGTDPETGAVDWEATHRFVWDLATPQLFTGVGDGKKILVSTQDSDARDPHLFETPAISPFQPVNIIQGSTGVNDIVYDTSTYTLSSPSGSFYSYFVVAPAIVSIQASVYNSRTQSWIYSNEIYVKISIPDYLNGLWIVDELNSIDTSEISSVLAAMDEDDVIGYKIPLGFRLRSPNITLAGALGGVTFLDINRTKNWDLWPSLGHKFEVTSIV